MLVVPSARRSGGGDVWVHQLLAGLGAGGVAPLVVFEDDGELVQHAQRCGASATVLAHRIGRPPFELGSLVAPLAEQFAAFRPEATVFWSPRAQIYGSAAHLAAGSPGRTAWVQHVIPSRFWIHQAAADAPSDLVICVSRAVQERHEQLYPQRRTAVVHPGLDVPVPLASRAEARRILGITPTGRVIGVVGRIEPWKGQDVAVRMLASLADDSCSLVLLGERSSATWPEFAGQVEALVAALGVADRVFYAGHHDAAARLLPGLDVLVCASREEGFGLAVLEAMAVGVPVVATRCGGPEDLIEHEVTGLLVEPEQPEALAAAVSRVLADLDLAEGLMLRARHEHRRRFTGRHSTAAFLSMLAALAHGRHPVQADLSQV
jgi:glycosyltransferase involved in cell wall biosynthesis